MKVVVTGGAGYLGASIVKRLAQNPLIDELIVYDNLTRGNHGFFLGNNFGENKGKIRFIEADILDSRSLRKCLENCDWLVHLAAKVTTPFSDQNAHLFEQVNHWGSAEVAYAAETEGVKNIIAMSSTSVYGASDTMLTIDSPLNPRTFYGISKMRAEQHFECLREQIPTYIFRCGNVFGVNESVRFDAVINKFLFEANCKGKIAINGDGKQKRSFISLDEVAEIVNHTIENKLKPSTYNLVKSIFSVEEIAYTLKELLPELEFIFINQSFKMRQSMVENESNFDFLENRTLKELLQMELDKFSFRGL